MLYKVFAGLIDHDTVYIIRRSQLAKADIQKLDDNSFKFCAFSTLKKHQIMENPEKLWLCHMCKKTSPEGKTTCQNNDCKHRRCRSHCNKETKEWREAQKGESGILSVTQSMGQVNLTAVAGPSGASSASLNPTGSAGQNHGHKKTATELPGANFVPKCCRCQKELVGRPYKRCPNRNCRHNITNCKTCLKPTVPTRPSQMSIGTVLNQPGPVSSYPRNPSSADRLPQGYINIGYGTPDPECPECHKIHPGQSCAKYDVDTARLPPGEPSASQPKRGQHRAMTEEDKKEAFREGNRRQKARKKLQGKDGIGEPQVPK